MNYFRGFFVSNDEAALLFDAVSNKHKCWAL